MQLIIAANTFRAFRKPWKELEPIVKSIEQTYGEIKDIIHFSSHFTGQVILAKVSKMLELIEGESVRFSKQSDIQQTSDLFRQRIEAKIEQHSVENPRKTDDDANGKTIGRASDELLDLDHQMATLFTDLNEFDEARVQQQRIAEQLPEMRRYRSTQRNVLKVDKVMDWVESKTSQLLLIDGNNILQRETFSASFVAPLLIFGESNFETSGAKAFLRPQSIDKTK